MEPARRSDEFAGAFLLVAIIGCLAGIAGASFSMWPLLWTATGVIVAGCAAMGVFVYRASRQSGTGVMKSFGRSAVVLVKMVLEIVTGG